MSVRLILGLGLVACVGCADVPLPAGPATATGPFPDLVPLDTLLAQGPGEARITAATAGDLGARVAGLRGRAAALAGPVVDQATRGRMQGAIARAALR